MRVLRQTARGMLAREKGLSFIKNDFTLRLLELERRAARLEAELPAEDRPLLEAYCKGVNQEVSALPGFKDDPWTLRSVLTMALLQSFDQTRRGFEQDIKTDEHARKGHALEMNFPWQTPILKKGEYLGRESHGSNTTLYPFAPEDQASGSNNWIIAPAHTKRKVAMLSNDPHLQLKSPPFWHWIHVRFTNEKSEKEEILGGSLPGLPLVASGGSLNMAWGLTNSYVDTADAVLVPREGLKTRKERPWIWFKLGWFRLPFFFKTYEVVEGADLPVLPIDSPEKDKAIVVRWTGFDLKASELSPVWRIASAKNVQEMDALLQKMGLPSWNYVFADTQGNIGYRVVGRLPKREWTPRGTLQVMQASELGPMPVLSADEVPHLLNPKRGWLSTANQLQWSSDARYSVGYNHTESFRGYRIEELLQQGLSQKHDVASLSKVICDTQAVDARFLLPVLLAGIPKSELTERLSKWDFDAGLECRECALYRAWMLELGDPQWVYARATQGDGSQKGRFFEEVAGALQKAAERVRRIQPAEGPWLRWGDVHRAFFPATEALRPFAFSRLEDAISTPGDNHSVAPGSSDLVEEGGIRAFSHHSGASQRVIWELTSPPHVHFALPETQDDRKGWAECRFVDYQR